MPCVCEIAGAARRGPRPKPRWSRLEHAAALVEHAHDDRLAVARSAAWRRGCRRRGRRRSARCGRPAAARRSAMSRSAMTFTRETSAGDHRRGHRRRLADARRRRGSRTRIAPASRSKWMSEAPRSTASATIEWTSLTTGASSAESRRSMTCGLDLLLDLGDGAVEPRQAAEQQLDVVVGRDDEPDLVAGHHRQVVGGQDVRRIGGGDDQRALVGEGDRDGAVAAQHCGSTSELAVVSIGCDVEVDVVDAVALADGAGELVGRDDVALEQRAPGRRAGRRGPPRRRARRPRGRRSRASTITSPIRFAPPSRCVGGVNRLGLDWTDLLSHLDTLRLSAARRDG